MKDLYGYQKAVLKWAHNKNHIALYLEMRLGKTLVTIRWIELKKVLKILVICPLPVIWTWQEELFSEGISSTILTGTKKEKEKNLADQTSRWYITNYEAIYETQTINNKRNYKLSGISSLPWDCVILDESTFIKNPKAIRTKMCRRAFVKTPYKAILSGLPNPEGPLDYYEQMAFLFGTFLNCKNYWRFRLYYFKQTNTVWNWCPKKHAISKIKKAVHEKAYVLSRKQAGIGSKKIYEKRYVSLSKTLQKTYTTLENEFEIGNDSTKWILTRCIWLARLAGGQPAALEFHSNHKLTEVLNLLQGELLKEQVIIWFRFNKELHRVRTELLKHSISNEIIIGDDSITTRHSTRQAFQKGTFRILLMQLKCGKFGIDCSAASTAIYYSNSFSYEERAQSEDRIISPNKKEPVLIIDLLTRNTIDLDVFAALKTKGMNATFFKSKIIANMQERTHGCASIR